MIRPSDSYVCVNKGLNGADFTFYSPELEKIYLILLKNNHMTISNDYYVFSANQFEMTEDILNKCRINVALVNNYYNLNSFTLPDPNNLSTVNISPFFLVGIGKGRSVNFRGLITTKVVDFYLDAYRATLKNLIEYFLKKDIVK